MEKSDMINELAAALSKAQSQMANPKKSAENPFFKMKYATLDEVWDVARKPLTENHLSIVQSPEKDGSDLAITTLLLHNSGQFLSSKLTVTPKAQDVQSVGSAITYARRYALMAILGIAPEDDDGEQAMNRDGKNNGKQSQKNKPEKTEEKPPQNQGAKPSTVPPQPANGNGNSNGTPANGSQFKCSHCSKDITHETIKVKGKEYPSASFSFKMFGKPLCSDCMIKEKARMEAEGKAKKEGEKQPVTSAPPAQPPSSSPAPQASPSPAAPRSPLQDPDPGYISEADHQQAVEEAVMYANLEEHLSDQDAPPDDVYYDDAAIPGL